MKQLVITLIGISILSSCNLAEPTPDINQAVYSLKKHYRDKIEVSNAVLKTERDIAPGQSKDHCITFSCEVVFTDDCSFDLYGDQYYHNGVYEKRYEQAANWWAVPMYKKGDKFRLYEEAVVFSYNDDSSAWFGSADDFDNDTRKTTYIGEHGEMSLLRYKLMRLNSQREHFNDVQFENLVNGIKNSIESSQQNGYNWGN